METEWVRGEAIGRGSFATVNLAIPRKCCSSPTQLMAVKSCEDCCSSTLKKEKEILNQIGFCSEIVGCFGDDYSNENGERLYNLFLEYASKGSLADQLKKNNGRGFEEFNVKKYTKSVVKGLNHIHSKGFVHCDIKVQNLLAFEDDQIKIADFGLAKRSGKLQIDDDDQDCKFVCRGTPLCMSPESINDNEYESAGDIWSLGCAVVEMLTGKPAWNCKQDCNVFGLLIRIGVGDELPIIPEDLSDEGKDFLMKCFVKDPKRRWTADMLLNHPFIACADSDAIPCCSLGGETEFSPKSPFNFPEWISGESSNSCLLLSSRDCLLDRIRQVECEQRPDWADSENWVTVR